MRGRCVESVIIIAMCLMKIDSPAVTNVCAGHRVNFPEDVRFDGSAWRRKVVETFESWGVTKTTTPKASRGVGNGEGVSCRLGDLRERR